MTILYRRTRDEMPAFEEEIEAAVQEGVQIQPLVSPVRMMGKEGRVTGIECIQNELGDADASGRRRPVPMQGTEHEIALDTLIVAIGEDSGVDAMTPALSSRIEITKWKTIKVNPETLATNRPGVFAAGDVWRGPNTVVEAIADGKRAAVMIERFLKKEPLVQPASANLPTIHVEPLSEEVASDEARVSTPRAPAEWRRRNFAEVEVSLSPQEAHLECKRCLRCDLEFTTPKEEIEAHSEARRQPA